MAHQSLATEAQTEQGRKQYQHMPGGSRRHTRQRQTHRHGGDIERKGHLVDQAAGANQQKSGQGSGGGVQGPKLGMGKLELRLEILGEKRDKISLPKA